MKRSNVFLGVLLLVLGIIFLGINYDFFQIKLYQISKAWPLLVVLAGISVLLSERRTIFNPASTILLAIAIPLAIYNGINKGYDKVSNKINDKISRDLNIDDFDFHEDDFLSENDEEFESEEENPIEKYSPDNGVVEQSFNVPHENIVTNGKLEIGGAGAVFEVGESNSKNTFSAETKLKDGRYKLSDDIKGNTHDIEFSLVKKKNLKFDIDDKNFSNQVKFFLNNKLNWELDLAIGAGKVDFDLTDFKIDKLEINSGAASINCKLGDQAKRTIIEINSGVASVELNIPKNSGARIEVDGLFNSNKFKGFEKVKSGVYETPNYGSATNKIDVDVNSALSSLEISRY